MESALNTVIAVSVGLSIFIGGFLPAIIAKRRRHQALWYIFLLLFWVHPWTVYVVFELLLTWGESPDFLEFAVLMIPYVALFSWACTPVRWSPRRKKPQKPADVHDLSDDVTDKKRGA